MPRNPVSTAEHYDRLAQEMADPACPKTVDPFDDPPPLRAWMSQADGPAFFEALGAVRGKAVLEIGIGTGRVAKKVLDLGCARLVGLDISPKTLERARRNLAAYPNLELILGGVESFARPGAFDIAYSVWTFFHVEDKPRALANAVASLKPGGRLVLSLERADEWFDYGSRVIGQFPAGAGECAAWLRRLGCHVGAPVEVPDMLGPAPDGRRERLTTIISATRPAAPASPTAPQDCAECWTSAKRRQRR